MLAEIAKDAVHKLVIVASCNAPMWISVPGGSLETVNIVNYICPAISLAKQCHGTQYGGHSCLCCGHAIL
jgi:hypothetical protein